MSMASKKLLTPEFRVAYPAVFRPRRNEKNGQDEYSVVALFDKAADLTKLKKACEQVIVESFGKDPAKWPVPPEKIRSPFRDQGERIDAAKRKGKPEPQGYVAGNDFINLRSRQKPGLVDRSKQHIIDESEFYGGCYAIASVVVKAYNKAGNCGVSCYLGNLQKVRDGEAFGNRSTPEDDFEEIDLPEGEEASGTTADLFS